MKKPNIARRLARVSGVTEGEAADRIETVVRHILDQVRRGKEAPLPGLGKFAPGPDGRVLFRPEDGEPNG